MVGGSVTDAPCAQVPGSSYGDRRGQRRKVQLMAAYRFVLGAENTIALDYITEKFWQLFGSRCAPCLHAAARCCWLTPLGPAH